MADLSGIYDATRQELAAFVAGLSPQDLDRPVPATPEWSVREVVAHVVGVVERTAAGDFPAEFFVSLGSEQGVVVLNEWTDRQVGGRRERALAELLDEWEAASESIAPMMRGEAPWPGNVMPFAGRILMTDLAVHLQDVYGTMGVVKGRDAAAIAIGYATYAAGVDLRIKASGAAPVRFVTEEKEVEAGGPDPVATVRAPRFELFRALSGRRSPDQVRAYDWDGDPEPFLELFYPYGVRQEALVE